MIHGINMRLRRIDLVEADYLHRRAHPLHDQPRPCARKPVQSSSVAVEQSAGQRKYSEKEGVEPDQGIENEIRSEPAQPPVMLARNGMRTFAERNRRVGDAFHFYRS